MVNAIAFIVHRSLLRCPSKPIAFFPYDKHVPSAVSWCFDGVIMAESVFFEIKMKKVAVKFGGNKKCSYLCNRLQEVRAFSSAGLEHLPYKQRVGGSNPSTPTKGCFPVVPILDCRDFFCLYICFSSLGSSKPYKQAHSIPVSHWGMLRAVVTNFTSFSV